MELQLGSKCLKLVILVTTREKGGSYNEETKQRTFKVLITSYFLTSVVIKQVFGKLHIYVFCIF